MRIADRKLKIPNNRLNIFKIRPDIYPRKERISFCNGLSPSLKVNKHEATALLIDEYKPAIAAAYRQLMDMCMSARYNDYNVKPSEARFARKKLNKIK